MTFLLNSILALKQGEDFFTEEIIFHRRNHFELFTARPEQTYIASSSGVFIGLIMSNKRGELYFIDNFRLSSTDTETKNYKTSSK